MHLPTSHACAPCFFPYESLEDYYFIAQEKLGGECMVEQHSIFTYHIILCTVLSKLFLMCTIHSVE